jgi:ketosteroid isomerase-like protein
MRRTFTKPITHLVLMFALTATASSVCLGQKELAKGGEAIASEPQAASVAEEILQLERIYDKAFIRPTAEDMERLHTDDFTMTARGKVTTRAELLARLHDPSYRPNVIESLTTDDVRVRNYGDAAVSTGRWKRVSKDADGKDTSAAGFFTHVWVKRNKTWLMAVAHYSPVAAPAKPQ